MNILYHGKSYDTGWQLLAMMAANWALKLFIAWGAYSIVTWLAAPMWLVIAVTAIAAVETKITHNG